MSYITYPGHVMHSLLNRIICESNVQFARTITTVPMQGKMLKLSFQEAKQAIRDRIVNPHFHPFR